MPRRFGNPEGERARKAVTARIRDAIRRITDAHPELGAHLDPHHPNRHHLSVRNPPHRADRYQRLVTPSTLAGLPTARREFLRARPF
jgi:hypothetical protein